MMNDIRPLVQLRPGYDMSAVRLRYDRYGCGIAGVRFTTGYIQLVRGTHLTEFIITNGKWRTLPEPSGAKILGLREGNTNRENAINMAAVASRT